MRELRVQVEILMAATPQILEWASPNEDRAALERDLAHCLASHAKELDRFEGLLRATSLEEVEVWAC